jgi:transcriptional regulator with XRE-family HTH domain
MVERIKELCSDNNTSIKALEKELGFGNGTIRRWDKNAPSVERIAMVANRFGVSMAYLMGDTDDPSDKSLTHWAELLPEENKKPTTVSGSGQIPNYSKLSDTNKSIVDSMIAQLLAAQSNDQ